MITSAGTLNLHTFANLAAIPYLLHFVTTRAGGFSLPPYDSLNLGLHTSDNPEHVRANRARLAFETGIDSDKFLYASQVHSGDVKVIDQQAIDDGILSEAPQTDATITNLTGICLMVMVADCVPVILFDPEKRVSAVVHAGWQGTVKHITTNTIHVMKSRFGCNPERILAGIGPSIGPCCYEVGEEVKAVVAQSFGTTEGYLVKKDNYSKPFFDLWYANHTQLTGAGLDPKNIETAALCTQCHSGTFYSSRAGKGITGRFAAGIYMPGPQQT